MGWDLKDLGDTYILHGSSTGCHGGSHIETQRLMMGAKEELKRQEESRNK